MRSLGSFFSTNKELEELSLKLDQEQNLILLDLSHTVCFLTSTVFHCLENNNFLSLFFPKRKIHGKIFSCHSNLTAILM